MGKYKVTFMPDNIAVDIEKDTNLLEAARIVGIGIESPCGGNRTCGKCAVKILSGDYQIQDDFHLSKEQKDLGYVLACSINVQSDLSVEIPVLTRTTKHKVVLSSKCNEENDYFAQHKLNPICKKINLILSEPTLIDSMNDLERIKKAIQKSYNVSEVNISLDCLRKIPETIRQSGFEITVTAVKNKDVVDVIFIEPGKSSKPSYGIAVDIGTTTVVVNLLNTEDGKIVSQAGTYNKQASYGSDVISRIIYTDENPDGIALLQKAIIDTINELVNEILDKNHLEPSDIPVIICGGNTVMMHLFMGITATYLRLEPYIPAAVRFPAVKAKELGININPNGIVLTIPSVASYVGGDITAGVFATMLNDSDDLTLFIDIGTNGELVLGNSEWLVTCSCSAGPAFEGSGISCGMRAMDGAIDWIDIDQSNLECKFKVINNLKPLGICGSGLIYSLSEMLKAGIIDKAGKIMSNQQTNRIRNGTNGPEYILVFAEESGSGYDIVITEGDIKNLLRAKGAIFAGIRTMLQQVQLDVNDIKKVYIAGGFGSYINITDAVQIGLLPDLPEEKYEYIGNSCIQGTMIGLLFENSLTEMEVLADKMTYLELSTGNMFMDEFISAVFIPHTDLSLFPSFGLGE